jgi:predicted Rossmann-fold nucleotide-binding protein
VRKLTLVYGGGRVGLMGEVAAAALATGGEVLGVIPHALSHKEIALADCTELIVVVDILPLHRFAAVAELK